MDSQVGACPRMQTVFIQGRAHTAFKMEPEAVSVQLLHPRSHEWASCTSHVGKGSPSHRCTDRYACVNEV